jgi:hypothetical protein
MTTLREVLWVHTAYTTTGITTIHPRGIVCIDRFNLDLHKGVLFDADYDKIKLVAMDAKFTAHR